VLAISCSLTGETCSFTSPATGNSIGPIASIPIWRERLAREETCQPPLRCGTEQSVSPMILPDDSYNRELVENVHPSRWTNPTPSGRYNLVVPGAGTAGLVSAVGAALLGAKVAIVEKYLMGGDCLNLGCLPSKALLLAASVVLEAREAAAFGIRAPLPIDVDFAAAMERMRKVRASISRHDSAEQLVKFGAEVFLVKGDSFRRTPSRWMGAG
jgi:hypothetical protein